MPSSGRWLILFAWGFRRLRAASDFLDAQKVTKEPLGGGSGWALRAHIRRPLEPHYGGRATGRFLNISGAQNLSGLCDSSRATSSSRISYPSLRPAGQSSLTPSLLLSNANPLRWALRWGPPSAACLGGKFQPVRVHWYAWLCRTNVPTSFPAVGATLAVARNMGRPVSGPYEKEGTASRFAVGAATSRPCLPL